MKGVVKLERAYGGEQAETLRNIIERADILALQETEENLGDNAYFKKYVLKPLSDRQVVSIDFFAFVYNTKKFSLDPRLCETIRTKRSAKCVFRVRKRLDFFC